MKRIITKKRIELFERELYREEKKRSTIEKYMRDLKKLEEFLGSRAVTKESMIQFKEWLQAGGQYEISSINTYLAAANHFCDSMQWKEAKVKLLRNQKELYESENMYLTKEEYKKLVFTANWQGKSRLSLIMQTIASTGIRISELCFITVESLKKGKVSVHNKGKRRVIFYPEKLQKMLRQYGREQGISSGILFRTKAGKAVDRSNIWKEMKRLCEKAGVAAEKVFPHNLRHLFAREFYEIKKDISKLADVLGHQSIETTRIYIKSTGLEHQRVLNRMRMVLGVRRLS